MKLTKLDKLMAFAFAFGLAAWLAGGALGGWLA